MNNRGIIGLTALFLILTVGIFAQSPAGQKRVLAVLDSDTIKSSHSHFFDNLIADGFKIDYTLASSKANFLKYGVYNYEHLILFAPHSEEFAGLDAEAILEFVDQGGNVLVAADSDASDAIKAIASDCNIELDQSGAQVIDHHFYETHGDDGTHSLIAADNLISDEVVVGSKVSSPVLFKGIGMDVLEDVPLIFPILSGSSFSYSHNPSSPVKKLHVAGKKTALVAALQARNNARILFSGSLDLFGNKFFGARVKPSSTGKEHLRSGNEEFSKAVTLWTFQERGAIRTSEATHHIKGETTAPSIYTIRDEITYSLNIEEWKDGKWVPFQSDDVQLEFIMLDPYLRIPLKADGRGNFPTDFIAPDVYGVFTFKVEFHKRGYGFVNVASQVPVRPYRHTQYERFIASAYPYYASAISMMVGLWVFSWFFLYTKE